MYHLKNMEIKNFFLVASQQPTLPPFEYSFDSFDSSCRLSLIFLSLFSFLFTYRPFSCYYFFLLSLFLPRLYCQIQSICLPLLVSSFSLPPFPFSFYLSFPSFSFSSPSLSFSSFLSFLIFPFFRLPSWKI